MFSLTTGETKELLRLMQLAHDCGQLFVCGAWGVYERPVKLEVDSDGDLVISVEDSE